MQVRKGHDILIVAALIIMAAMVINFRWPLLIGAVDNTYCGTGIRCDNKKRKEVRLRAGHVVAQFDALVVVGCLCSCLVHF